MDRETNIDAISRGGPTWQPLTVRAYNLCMREGVRTVGALVDLKLDAMNSWRNCRVQDAIEIATFQTAIRTRLDRDVRTALIETLVHHGLAETEPGYGHATGEEIADTLLKHFDIEEKDPQ